MKKTATIFIVSFLCCSAIRAEDFSCRFDTNTLSFASTPLEQAKCLLRPVAPFGRLGKPPEYLPAPLENLIGQPMKIKIASIEKYLRAQKIDEADIGGALTNHLAAKYFAIHDTSTPNYLDKEFPNNINTAAWPHNGLAHWTNHPVAHMFVNRLGQSLTAHTFVTPWRATKLEVKIVGEKSRGQFVHTELVQPRQRDPTGAAHNDAIAPTPGFTDAQYDRLALLYLNASAQHGTWLIPAYHCAIDAGIPNGHDDPQNFDLAFWVKRLEILLNHLRDQAK